MSAFWAHGVGVVTLILMLIFVAIWIWAWLPHHRHTFDALAKLPMEDDDVSRPGRPDSATQRAGTGGDA